MCGLRVQREAGAWAEGPLVVSSSGRLTHTRKAHAQPHLKLAGLAYALRICGQRVVPHQRCRTAGGTGSVVGIQSGLWGGGGCAKGAQQVSASVKAQTCIALMCWPAAPPSQQQRCDYACMCICKPPPTWMSGQPPAVPGAGGSVGLGGLGVSVGGLGVSGTAGSVGGEGTTGSVEPSPSPPVEPSSPEPSSPEPSSPEPSSPEPSSPEPSSPEPSSPEPSSPEPSSPEPSSPDQSPPPEPSSPEPSSPEPSSPDQSPPSQPEWSQDPSPRRLAHFVGSEPPAQGRQAQGERGGGSRCSQGAKVRPQSSSQVVQTARSTTLKYSVTYRCRRHH